MRQLIHLTAVLAAVVIVSLTASVASAQTRVVNQSQGVAIKGYDPVAYFTQSDAVKGDATHRHIWNDATWLFATAANRDAFAADPEKFAPQYGGYCAYAMSRNYIADITPTAWKIVEGKLYLNNSRPVHVWWQADIAGNIAQADTNWPGKRSELAN